MQRRPYELTNVNGDVVLVYSNTALPDDLWASRPQTNRLTVPRPYTGPKYDGTVNSITAALIYERYRTTCRALVFRHLVANANVNWVNGKELKAIGGGQADRRARELRDPQSGGGFPIKMRSRGRGDWDYMMVTVVPIPPIPTTSPPATPGPRKRVIKRTSPPPTVRRRILTRV